uniref:Bm159 n=1 Tax=Brugia malayi TaxID=6279 RepID=A0A1I9GEX3_BRUMA|nr:Bm159 [Brugia malayi]
MKISCPSLLVPFVFLLCRQDDPSIRINKRVNCIPMLVVVHGEFA